MYVYYLTVHLMCCPVGDGVKLFIISHIRWKVYTTNNGSMPGNIIIMSSLNLFCVWGCIVRATERSSYGITIIPVVANIFMDDLEERALNSARLRPSNWA